MRHLLSPMILAAGLLSMTSVSAETMHPSGNGVTATYALSAASMTSADTLVIARTLVNGAAYSLSSVYLSENLPTAMSVVSAVVKIDGVPVSVADSLAASSPAGSGFIAHSWILGTPSGGTNLAPGDSLSLEIRVTCSDPGVYSLPMHATVGYVNGSGFFAADSAAVTVTTPADTTPPAAITNLSAAGQ